jgi:hypothetical protein
VPHRLRPPVVVDAGLVDAGEEAGILDDAVADLAGVVVFLVTDALAVEVGGRDVPDHRLTAGAGAGEQDLDQVLVPVGVELVDDGEVGVESVLGVGVEERAL